MYMYNLCTSHAHEIKIKYSSGQMAHAAGAYPGLRGVKQLWVFLLPPGWDASPSQGYPPPSTEFTSTRLYN